MKMMKGMEKMVISLVVILSMVIGLSMGVVTQQSVSGISTSLYGGYAMIGANPNSKMPFATLLTKSNTTMPYSSSNQYGIASVFSDPTALYGTTVALGPATHANGTVVTIGAIGSPTESTIYIFNIQECISSGSQNCDPFITFTNVSKKGNNNQIQRQQPAGLTTKAPSGGGGNKDKEFECQIGSIIGVGDNFVVSACQNDLLNQRKRSSPIVICFINIDDETNVNCTDIVIWDDKFNPCKGEKGQLYVTAIDVDGSNIVFTYCGVCMSPPGNNLIQVQFVSAFVFLNVTTGNIVNNISTTITNRTDSCPNAIAMNRDFIVVGYTEESIVDVYSSVGTDGSGIYQFFETLEEASNGFGSDVDLGGDMVVVSSPGNINQQENGVVYFYELFKTENGTVQRVSIEATVPNLNYETEFDYEFEVSYFNNELLVVSMDDTLGKVGFNVYSACQYGSEWSSIANKCSTCQAGLYKSISNTNPNVTASFELCFPCPGGYYTGPIMGIASEIECRFFNCSDDQYCPEGSVYPLRNILVQSNSFSNPNPTSTDDLDFESTFYNSYPWFLIILAFAIVITISICLPWPKFQPQQQTMLKYLLKVNFYDWDGEDMIVEEDYLEAANVPSVNGAAPYGSLSPSVVSGGTIRYKTTGRGIFVRKRRTKVKPVKAVESFCSYYFLMVLLMMILFIVQFQKLNSDLSIELRSYGQASTDLDLKSPYTELQYLKFIDSSPIQIQLDLYGYSGLCTRDEIALAISGCQTPNYMGVCNYELWVRLVGKRGEASSSDSSSGDESTSSSSSSEEERQRKYEKEEIDRLFEADDWEEQEEVEQGWDSDAKGGKVATQRCRIIARFNQGSEFADTSAFAFQILPNNSYYFYAQRLLYNISTINNNTLVSQGNSYVTGVVQPPVQAILRPEAQVTVLSMLTFITDCNIHNSNNHDFALVRPMVERCAFDKKSYKDFSFLSNSTTYMDSTDYHDSVPSFTFTLNIEKSVFFRYVSQSTSVSFGQIVTVIMFAMLDIFWVIEVIVPVCQTAVELFEKISNRSKRKNYDEIGTKPYAELDKFNQPANRSDGINNKSLNNNSNDEEDDEDDKLNKLNVHSRLLNR